MNTAPAKDKTPPLMSSLAEFLLNAPLYEIVLLDDDNKIISQIYGNSRATHKFDGHCPSCGKETTYTVTQTGSLGHNQVWSEIKEISKANIPVTITCARESHHVVSYHLRKIKMQIQKIGQFPSLADIANNEIKLFRNQLSKEDGAEFYKAIGLAAHGVGVGSFVYLRRIFENLVQKRFDKFKEQDSLDATAFQTSRMTDKIIILKNHLPPFLVENAKIYSILSQGIHELDEQTCLKFFPVMKESITTILAEDSKKREDEERRKKLALEIAAFAG